MSAPLRRTLLCLLVAALAFLAHAPLFGSGFVGGDLDLLAAAAGTTEPGPAASAWLARGEVRPVPAAILRAHADLYEGLSPLEPAVAAPYFAFALIVLLVAAAGAGVTLRRVLVPWLGESAARAAGWACAGIVVAHPASVAAVARPIALGDLLALAAGTWCTAFFLRGRQQRRDRFLVIASVLALAAGFASSAAWLLPFACAALEFTSAHRPRPFPRRLAAAAVVALAACIAVSIEAGFAWPHGFGLRGATPYAAFFARPIGTVDPRLDPVAALSTMGVLFVPAPSPGVAGFYFACGAILLLAAEPLLRAVRAAPRLWGWLVLGWMLAMGAAFFVTRDLPVPAGRIELGSALLPAAILVCAALATAATALGGSRRTVIPVAIAALLCILSDRTARIWPSESRQLLALRGDLERGLATAGPTGIVEVVGALVDAADSRRVEDSGRSGFGPPHELELIAGVWPPPRMGSGRARRAQADALPYLARLASFEDVRRRGLAVLMLDREGHPVFVVPAPRGAATPLVWSEDGRSELVELDPVALTMVRVTPRVGISTAEPPRMRWRATDAAFENGTIEGAWIATDTGPQAIFDLGRSLEWLFGGTIRRVSFGGDLNKIVTAEVLPRIELEPEREGIQGFIEFVLPDASRPRAWAGDPEWVLMSIDPGDGSVRKNSLIRLDERELKFDTTDAGCSLVEIPVHVLECRVSGVTVARSKELDRIAR